jgi:Xaa-Pro dipeptidase
VGNVAIGADVSLGAAPRCYGSGDETARASARAPRASGRAQRAGGPSGAAVVDAARRGADPEAIDLRDELSALRRVLDAEAIARLRAIGADLTAALDEVARALNPGMTEHEAAGRLAHACRARGLVPTVLLAATHERIARHRHPLPTGARLERRAMIVASAQRGGLYANLTRIAGLDERDAETQRRQQACDDILARAREEATRPDRSLTEAFADVQRFYAEAGFPGEWRLHHQGGITGYASREVIATPHTDVPIEPGMAFAWNPSIAGAKAEETFVLTETGPELVAGAALAVA